MSDADAIDDLEAALADAVAAALKAGMSPEDILWEGATYLHILTENDAEAMRVPEGDSP